MPTSAVCKGSLGHTCLLTGSTNMEVAREVAVRLRTRLTPVVVRKFPVGEIHTEIQKSVRAKEAFVLATANTGRINDDLMETKILLQTLRLASVRDIFLLMLAMPYQRQDRKDRPRVPITAVLAIQELCNAAGGKMQSLVTFDPHTLGAEGFMSAVGIPAPAALSTKSLFVDYLKRTFPLNRLLLIPPDIGRTKWVASIAKKIYGEKEYFLHYLPVEKVRVGDELLTYIYERKIDEIRNKKLTFKDKEVVILDDMIDSGRTIRNISYKLAAMPEKPRSISAAAVHGYFTGTAPENFEKDPTIDQVIVTNTLNIPKSSRFSKLKILDVSQLVAEIISRIVNKESLEGYSTEI